MTNVSNIRTNRINTPHPKRRRAVASTSASNAGVFTAAALVRAC